MDNLILIRYGEIHLKGKNRRFFENALIKNIQANLKDYQHTFERSQARYVVSDYRPEDQPAIIAALKKTFGIHSISVAHVCESGACVYDAHRGKNCLKKAVRLHNQR